MVTSKKPPLHVGYHPAVTFTRANLYAATFAMIFSRDRYLDMAGRHNMAINLESSDCLTAHQAGQYPAVGWERELRMSSKAAVEDLLTALSSAFQVTLFCAMAGVFIAVYFQMIALSLPFSPAKSMSVIGGFLAAWATLFELGGFIETFGGESLHELVRPILFRVLFLPGLVIATIGQLW